MNALDEMAAAAGPQPADPTLAPSRQLIPPSDAECDGTFYGCGNMLPEDRCGRCVDAKERS